MATRPGQLNTHAGTESCFSLRVRLASLCSRGWFSSLFWSRMMLRHPSAFQSTCREEGCSSTAFGLGGVPEKTVWTNPAVRGSVFSGTPPSPALP